MATNALYFCATVTRFTFHLPPAAEHGLQNPVPRARGGAARVHGASKHRRQREGGFSMKRGIRILIGCALAAAASIACAQAREGEDFQVPAHETLAANDGRSLVAAKLAGQYAHLAGSEDNALALVMALREGSAVRLTAPDAGGGTPDVTTIEPPTGRMGWSDVKFALVIAQDALYRHGITRPTGEQLQAALTGGDLTRADGTVIPMKGILQMRADGMGWKQIAANTRGRSG
jgi:hypothetical protein